MEQFANKFGGYFKLFKKYWGNFRRKILIYHFTNSLTKQAKIYYHSNGIVINIFVMKKKNFYK